MRMETDVTLSWHEANQRYLTEALGEVRLALTRHTAPESERAPEAPYSTPNKLSDTAALETLCHTFQLSTFERLVLLLCAGMELDARFADLCGAAHQDPNQTTPTFSLALSALPHAHWSALTPDAPLRRWRLIEVQGGPALTTSPLRIDERILHYLTGLQPLDENLCGFVQPVSIDASTLSPSHLTQVDEAVHLWSGATPTPVIELCGNAESEKLAVASALCARLGMQVFSMSAQVLPQTPHEFEILLRLWEREAILSGSALILDGHDDGNQSARLFQFVDRLHTPLLFLSRDHRHIRNRSMVTFFVEKPEPLEQQHLWESCLGAHLPAINGCLEQLSSQFNLSQSSIQAACFQAMPPSATVDPGTIATRLWDACRTQARPRLGDLAQRIPPVAGWNDLILPERQIRTLKTIVVHVRQRMKVYEQWGFSRKSARGLGISALFTGQSGTGKTMAAEVIAHELRLDLYRIDLSQVVSKYIGETEKNLRRVFYAAEEGGAILLFDEADALFGKRTEVKDSHDRYANIEVGYLLQCMEAYRGLAILTTNLKGALDDAFQRRIRFIVSFPFPDVQRRTAIWQHIFPEDTPTQRLDMSKIARLNITGGSIRNIAMNAAFFAAENNTSVSMKEVLQAARLEYAKQEKPLTESEIRGWI